MFRTRGFRYVRFVPGVSFGLRGNTSKHSKGWGAEKDRVQPKQVMKQRGIDRCAFSCVLRCQERIVQAGAVPAIIALSVGEGVEVALQRRCAAALCNLACTPANIARMVEVGGRSTTADKRGRTQKISSGINPTIFQIS